MSTPNMPSIRKKFVVGNWKMYTTAAEAGQLAGAIAAELGVEDRVAVAICPPFPYLGLVGAMLKGSCIALGAQNMYPKKEGAFTGEVSPTMLLDLGCKYVIVGHSERRHVLGESDAFVNEKALAALDAGLDIFFCVGETLDERNAGQTEAVLDRQLSLGLVHIPQNTLARVSIGYEPVWAIGSTGHHATPQQAQDAHTKIRYRFGQLFGMELASKLCIQYGGSVKPTNAAALFMQPDVDGALIGADSLNTGEFVAIVRAALHQAQVQEKATWKEQHNESDIPHDSYHPGS
jgi:triosephosphate isomerase